MKLEVGKTYLARSGENVTIERWDGCDLYPFLGRYAGDWRAWTEEGRYIHTTYTHRMDLVAEAPAEQPWPLKEPADPDATGRSMPYMAHGNGHYSVSVSVGQNTAAPASAATVLTPTYKTAPEYLAEAQATMIERGKQYDSPAGERSMGKTIAAFNLITGRDLTEAEGWLLMSVLKKVRQYQGKPHMDSCVDDVAYAALFAEARMQETK